MSIIKKKSARISRRGFLALSAAGAAGTAVSGCTPHKLADFLELSESGRRAPQGEEKWVTSICGQCEGGCSIRVRTVGGRAVNITGNPFYPLNRNGLCPTGLAGLQALDNPDRLHGPLRRAGQRGEGKWEAISWEEAIGTVAQQLREIRDRAEPHSLLFLTGDSSGLMGTLIDRFCRAYGTPNDIRKLSPDLEGRALVGRCAHGRSAPFAFDLDNSNCILSFGSPLLEASVSPVRMLRAYGYLRQERPGPRAKIIQIEPRFSPTAAKADEWIPINPGTEGALALGLAYVLIREGLYDRSFVENHTFGFEDWQDAEGNTHTGFRKLVLQDYNVDAVVHATGVPVATVLRMAKEFAAHRPAVAIAQLNSTNALYSLLAVQALNALVGSIDVPGGVVFPREAPLKPLPEADLDERARQGLAQPRLDRPSSRDFPLARHVPAALPQAILEQKPYPTNAVFLYYTNPVFSAPEPLRFARAFEKVPLIASFSPFIDESSAIADLILPDHTPLERWQDAPTPPVAPYSLFGLRQPVVNPLYDTMHTGDVLMRIARAIGGSTGQAFPWPGFLDVLRESATGLHEARRGAIVEPFTTKPWTALLEERGWWSLPETTFDDFWAQLQDKGGWWDPIYYFNQWDRIFQTPSGKYEFYSLTLKKIVEGQHEGAPREEAKRPPDSTSSPLASAADQACLPHFEPPRFVGDSEQYPFHVNIIRPLPLACGRDGNQPFLQEILDPRLHVRWDSWVEINPQAAEQHGIQDGAEVWLESPVGKLKARARLNPGAMPDVVNIPANLGHTAYGRWAKDIGVNPMLIVASEHDDLAGLGASGATRVRVYKA